MKSLLPSRIALFASLLLLSFHLQAQVKFSYLGQYNSLGVPDNLEDTSDIISQDFLNDINNALPEKKSVPQFHPEYIVQKNETDVVLNAPTDLWITFVHEAAGYTNALGYYTYSVSNPPKTTADINPHWIVFPNVSYENSGGALKSGNKIYLGKFNANTAIGWFLVADAFKNGKVTQGKYIIYSEPSLNPEKDAALKAHTVLLKDSKRNKLVLGFEDMLRDQGSDQDFNDVMFYITASSYNAINTTDVVSIDGSGTGTVTTNPNTTGTTTTPTTNDPTVLVPTTTNNNTTNNNTTNNNTTNNNPNININNNVNNNGQNSTGGSTTNTTNTTNNVNTGTNTNTNTNSNNSTTNNNTNTNSNNNTTVINNTTIINNTGGGGGRRGNGNNNANNNTNNNTNTNVNNNTNNNTNTNGNGGNGGNGNGNNNGGNNNNNSANNGNGNNNNTNVSSNVTVCNRDGIALSNFNSLKTTIKSQTVESNKPMVIKQAVRNKKVTVSQVKEMIKLINIEQYKLDMAKYLFDYTCDKSNYYELNALLLPSRARELDAYLKDKDMSDDNVTSVNTNVTNSNNGQNTTNITYVETNGYTSGATRCDNGLMPYEEFADIKQSISSKSFSSDKMTILKEAMPSRCINSTQVREIMQLFSFEADKLSAAKYLYRFTSDKQNYYKVNDAFSFSSSIDELKGYIKTVK